MKFLHTADWQIGMKARRVGERGGQVRDARIATARRIAELAVAEKVDFVLLAGDTFEDHGVSPVTVKQVARILETMDRPVYVIPGNHDPARPGSVWENRAWSETANVTLLAEPAPVAVAGGTLFPCPVNEPHSLDDPAAWIPASGNGGIRIGLAHGNVVSDPSRRDELPLPRDAAERHGLDYLALGHWHSLVTYAAADGAVRMAYPGTPETTGFGERDSGNVLIVEIREPGAPPRCTAHPVGQLRWLKLERRIRTEGELAATMREFDEVERPETTLVECILTGTLFPGELAALKQIAATLDEAFLYGALDCDGLIPEPDGDEWLAGVPEGYLKTAAGELLARAAEEYEARDALRLFRELCEEPA